MHYMYHACELGYASHLCGQTHSRRAAIMGIHDTTIIQLCMWIGTWQRHIVNGAVPTCPPRPNGRKPRAPAMNPRIPGEMSSIATKPITQMAREFALAGRPKWAVTRAGRVLTACMIWQATFGSGWRTGIRNPIMGLQSLHPTPRDRILEGRGLPAAAHGPVLWVRFARPTASTIRPHTLTSIWVSAVLVQLRHSGFSCVVMPQWFDS